MNAGHYTPQHSGCARLRGVQTSARPAEHRRRVPFVRRVLAWIRDWHRRWYEGEIERDRRVVEEDARRLGGTVTWND